ncbi:397_t:CDS:2 [Scutellospora calospora]|uniref:397_t:CDS:1 n=1 Tax=Scutellospora calospora TaxID=85575 RepID=A0ACA9KGU3_9GLOM|nr:397_t:CDS:2 [Scutellospora calospora]
MELGRIDVRFGMIEFGWFVVRFEESEESPSSQDQFELMGTAGYREEALLLEELLLGELLLGELLLGELLLRESLLEELLGESLLGELLLGESLLGELLLEELGKLLLEAGESLF